MKISIFGLGYVGMVTAACFAKDGHHVIGVDVNKNKVDLINQGESPIIEPGLEDLLKKGVQSGQIKASVDSEVAVMETEISLISVGTPPIEQGQPDLSYVLDVCKEIAIAVEKKGTSHVVMLRSTVPPGTLEHCHSLMQEVTKKDLISTAFNPEFLREGTAIKDFDYPPYTIIGTESKVAEQALRQLYQKVKAPIVVVEPAVAEMIKYVANTWHATKVSFANEIGRVSKAFGIDGREVMNVIVQDDKLNISSVYMRPGFAYGGSCLPKDLGALLYYARSKNVFAPLINAVPATNNLQINLAVEKILKTKVRNIAILGLAFKPNTDDLRESPSVYLIKRLLGEGCQIKIYDPAVYKANLIGTNLNYIQQNIPHFQNLLVGSFEEAFTDTELAVATHNTPKVFQALEQASPKIKILDLVGVFSDPPKNREYEGLAW
ncbi:UDP-glucose/GDP-mannose dehydrogenase family protein [Pleurocapsa sp. PCC 7319]|uniref:UDP-glucose dehydrogenase family protein n=1 Tax=Pleurocapsa sp. PCC 7319 TaxID=118161 RepID=UPI000349CBD0|nr:UDP-glucose/GDP-mannose dehydrogenase family protein [Pleurocapsa sp. PCC 7319]